MAAEDKDIFKKYIVNFHQEFLSDMKKLDKREREAVSKHIDKIAQNPEHFKHLHGKGNCYTLRIGNLRVVYSLEGNTIIFLVAERRKEIYDTYHKRLYTIHEKLE